ncbi:hypothetical protein [Kitasatospora sp. NBC_01266]|uniref:hypothetical protein n=1 Tax=Kitasatospora sp. NBC_01266 TaxID=2903572 RepID=UPI003FA525AE
MTQGVESPLANVCDSNYTSVAKMRKAYLPSGSSAYGVHEVLRQRASQYLAG